MPSFTTVPNGWTTNRYDPASFSIPTTPQFGRTAELQIQIDQAQGETNRPPALQSQYYGYQGRSHSLAGAGAGDTISADIYIPSALGNIAAGNAASYMWGIGSGANGDADYLILGFTNSVGHGEFTLWDDTLQGWIDLAATVNYDNWNSLSIRFTGTTFDYYVNGVKVYSVANSFGTLYLGATILNAVNFFDPTTTFTGRNYTIYWSDAAPDLAISKTHTGSFTQAQNGATYTIAVSNAGGVPTTAPVTVVDTLPNGLSAAGIAGTGWSCVPATLTCTRSDALAAAASWPPISVSVNVASNAPASLTNIATVSGGGELNTTNDTSRDVTAVSTRVLPPLTILTSALPSGLAGQSYGPVTLMASGGSGVFSWSATGLPSTFGFSQGGVLSGSPTAAFNGSIAFTVTDQVTQATATASLLLNIVAPPLSLGGPTTLGSVAQGTAISAAFTISGVPGLAVDGSGRVSGPAGTPGNFSATLSLTDSQNVSTSRTLSLSVFGIITGGLPPGSTGSAYSASVAATGGTQPYTFTASNLPPGVTFSGGTFGGTPTAAGNYTIGVRATDGGGLTVTANYPVSIVAGVAPLAIFTSSLTATAGQPYADSLSATGGTGSYTWTQSGGVLPTGLTLGSSGSVSGNASTPGSYALGVRVTDGSGTTVVATVTINVQPAPLQITSGSVFPSGVAGIDYPVQALTASGGMAPYTFSTSGSLPAGLSLSGAQIGGTPSTGGSSDFTLKVTDSSTPPLTAVLGVNITIRAPAPDIVLALSSVSFAITSGVSSAPPPYSVGVTSSIVTQNISYSVSTVAPWLTVTSGTATPGLITIGLNNAALALAPAATPYSATVVVACSSSQCSGNPGQTITVKLAVSSPPPLLSLGVDLFSFNAQTTNPVAQAGSLPILNAGGGQLKITSAASDSAWLKVGTPPDTVLPGPGGAVGFTTDPTGLAAGFYRGNITVTSSGGTAKSVATLYVSAAPTMTLAPAGAQFTLPQGGALGNNTGSFSVGTSLGATVAFNATAMGASWLQVTGGSGTASSASPATVAYTIDQTAAGALAVGSYFGTIRVSGSGVVNSPQDFQVVLTVTAATAPVLPDPQPAGLVFVTTVNAPASSIPGQKISLFASSRAALPYQAWASTDNGTWLSASPTTGTTSASAPKQIGVSVDPTGLAVGAYRGQVNFSIGSAVRTVNVTLIVQSASAPHTSGPVSKAAPSCSGAQLVPTQTGLVNNFSVPASWPTPLSIMLFDTCGATVGGAQAVATFNNGDPPLVLSSLNPGSGMYSGTWTPRGVASQVTITASVSAAGYPGASARISGQAARNTAPVLAANGAGDIFNPEVGAGLGPGNIVQIYGSGLATLPATPAALPLPTAVSGTQVIIGGVQAPLFYVSPTQINAQIPLSLEPGHQYQLLVSANGALTTPLPLQLNTGAPAILDFTSGAVVAQHADGRLVSTTAPAVPGEFIVLYASGLGATDIPVPSGAPSPSNPPAMVLSQPSLTLSGAPVTVAFAGLTPGLVGLYQINFQVPANLAPGTYNLVLTQDGVSSNTTVLTVAKP
jgi:uncharacterized protein (TIGR03437 family)